MRYTRLHFSFCARPSLRLFTLSCLLLLSGSGCWAPLTYRGIPASELGEEYRLPRRTAGAPLNLAALTVPQTGDYILDSGDVLDVTIHGLYPGAEIRPVRVRIMANGEIYLPMVGAVKVGGMNLVKANESVTNAYADGFIKDPRTNVILAEKATTSVVVLGEVRTPGVQRLPRYENDIAHAIASAGGLAEDAADEIEVHRRRPNLQLGKTQPVKATTPADSTSDSVELVGETESEGVSPVTTADLATHTTSNIAEAGVTTADQQAVVLEPGMEIVRIPLRGTPLRSLMPHDVSLQDGDVVVVPSRKSEVFYVVGKLSPTNFVRFNIGARERDLGAGFLLPPDREIDIVTAVAMAGYIDPIDSPTTVTVHRICPGGDPMLVTVDLIKARTDRRENLNVEPGDIIYLNPDFHWWFRRTFDRMVPNFFSFSTSYRFQ